MPKSHRKLHTEIIEKIEQAQIGTAGMGYDELLEWIKKKLAPRAVKT
jgi:hypothetical protein